MCQMVAADLVLMKPRLVYFRAGLVLRISSSSLWVMGTLSIRETSPPTSMYSQEPSIRRDGDAFNRRRMTLE